MKRRTRVSLVFIILATAVVMTLSHFPLLLSLALVALAFGKHMIAPIKIEMVWYLLIFLGSAIVEIVLVNTIHAWAYTDTYMFGVPVWAPLYWAVLGTTIVSLYEGLTS